MSEESTVYVIQMRSPGSDEWRDTYLYSLNLACETFERLASGVHLSGYAFRMVKRVTREIVLDHFSFK